IESSGSTKRARWRVEGGELDRFPHPPRATHHPPRVQCLRTRNGRPFVSRFHTSLPARSNSSTQWPSVLATRVLPFGKRVAHAGVCTLHCHSTRPASSISTMRLLLY